MASRKKKVSGIFTCQWILLNRLYLLSISDALLFVLVQVQLLVIPSVYLYLRKVIKWTRSRLFDYIVIPLILIHVSDTVSFSLNYHHSLLRKNALVTFYGGNVSIIQPRWKTNVNDVEDQHVFKLWTFL